MRQLYLSTVFGIVAGLTVMCSACAWWSSKGEKATVGAAAGCVVGDVAKYAGDIQKDLALADYEAQIAQFKADHNFTQDALNCLISTVLAVIESALPTGSQLSPVITNGRAYLVAHAKTASIAPFVPTPAVEYRMSADVSVGAK